VPSETVELHCQLQISVTKHCTALNTTNPSLRVVFNNKDTGCSPPNLYGFSPNSIYYTNYLLNLFPISWRTELC